MSRPHGRSRCSTSVRLGVFALALGSWPAAAATAEDTRSHRQRRHEVLVAAVETRLAEITAQEALPLASTQLLALADCAGTTCHLNALGHARVLVDWTELQRELTGPAPHTIAPLGGAGALVGPVAAAVTASATAAIEAIRVWTENAIKRRLKREAIVALVDRLSRELCTPTTKGLLPRLCSLADDEALNHVSAGGAQLAVIRSAVQADLDDLPARAFVTDDAVLPRKSLDDARTRFVARLRVGESAAILLPDLAGALRRDVNADAITVACYLELVTNALGFADPLAGQPADVAAAAAVISAAATTPTCSGLVLGADVGTPKEEIATWTEHHVKLESLGGAWRVVTGTATAYAVSAATVNAGSGDAAAAADAPNSAQVRAARALQHALAAIAFAGAVDRFALAFVALQPKLMAHPSPADTAAADALRALEHRIDLVELAVVGDYGQLIADVSKPGAAAGAADEQAAIRRLAGMLTALATEDDPEELLAAVQAVALPAASWRTKMHTRAFTASFGAQLGLTSAVEQRFGTYGAGYYRGDATTDLAWAAPTLFFPIGLDLAWKQKCATVGAFLPIVDPAAFLQYDMHAGGRLPGARVTTILSPGAALRVSIGRSPISFMVYAVFRPQLRSWDATVFGPGASVMQYGVAFTWDIPFLVMRVKEASR